MTSWGAGRVVITDDQHTAHTVNLLGPRPAGQVRQAVVVLEAIDELTDRPVQASLQVTTSFAGLTGGAGPGGTAGLIGVPTNVVPALATQSYSIDVTVLADGFVPWTQTVTLAAQPSFPETFTGVDLGAVSLRHAPVSLEITTVGLDAQNRPQPLAGVDVRISRVWRSIGDIGAAGSAAPMIALPLGISQHWPTGTALDSVSLLPAAESPRRLLAGTAPGDVQLAVDRLGALAVGDLIGLDLADADRREYVPLAAVLGQTDPASPTSLETATPVRVAHAIAATARRVPAPSAAPPDATLTERALPGDTTVFVDTVAPFATVEVLRAHSAGMSDEYLEAHLMRATTDASGFARIAPVSRVAAVEFTATRGPLTATASFTPDYLSSINTVVLTLR